MKEILAGDGFCNFVEDLKINAKLTYKGDVYEVWEMSDEVFSRIDLTVGADFSDNFDLMSNWKSEWGWWRHSFGSVLEDDNPLYPEHGFTIRGKTMKGYYSLDKYLSYVEDMYEDGEDVDEDDPYYFTYSCLTEYLAREIGATSEKNVCAIATSLAKINNMTLAELFNTYEGVVENEKEI